MNGIKLLFVADPATLRVGELYVADSDNRLRHRQAAL